MSEELAKGTESVAEVKTTQQLKEQYKQQQEEEALHKKRVAKMKHYYKSENEMLELVTTNLKLTIDHHYLTKQWAKIQVEEAGNNNSSTAGGTLSVAPQEKSDVN
jgi:hypothetical protein